MFSGLLIDHLYFGLGEKAYKSVHTDVCMLVCVWLTLSLPSISGLVALSHEALELCQVWQTTSGV